MTFGLELRRLDGGGQPRLSFGIKEGSFIVGNGGVNVDILGGMPAATEMRIVLRVEYGDGATGPDDLEVLTVWVDPIDVSSVPVIEKVPVDILNRGGGRLAGVAMRGDQMAGQPAFFDDLMVGYRFEDVVQPPSAGALTNHAGLNGLFYDPAKPGHGFNFAVHNLGLTVYYFGHTANGERVWLVSKNHTGDIEFNTPIELRMYEVITGTYGHPQLPATSWGSATIELADCDTGHAALDGVDGALEIDFIRLSAMPGIGCH
jgi:hypothetical protein